MISTQKLSTAAWRKSSYSNGEGGACLEVADGYADLMPVRDSKAPRGPALAIPAASWSAFVGALKNGTLR